ncbi:MAG TPA: hypothetical protein VMT38_02585 [Terracidiphilus sp.]|nr:hypothetical protein [Terracidiphilus sp.]
MVLHRGSHQRVVAVVLGAVTLAAVALLLGWDAFPLHYPAGSHRFLGAFSLALIALAYLVDQSARRPTPLEFAKAAMLAAAFLFWAANQYWPNSPQATVFNDIAIALFVLDVFLVIAGWPKTSFAECCSQRCDECAASRGNEGCCCGSISAQ